MLEAEADGTHHDKSHDTDRGTTLRGTTLAEAVGGTEPSRADTQQATSHSRMREQELMQV